jgi:hypothetical protein
VIAGADALNAPTFRRGEPDELNLLGLRRSRVVHHPPSWATTDVVEGRLVGVPRWGSVDVTVQVVTATIGSTEFPCQLSLPAVGRPPEIDWTDVRQRLAGEAMIGTSIIVRYGLNTFGRQDVFRAVTALEMLCPNSLDGTELETLDELLQ